MPVFILLQRGPYMIQDIAPNQLFLSYDLHEPSAASRICIFSGPRILAAQTQPNQFSLPRFCELPVEKENCQFLFSISNTDYFFYTKNLSVLGGDDTYLSLRHLLSAAPQVQAFAAVTAWHLARWYQDNRYCGRCGHPTAPHRQERALQCTKCGNIIYPRINPAIIVAVTDGDRLLITKYAANRGPTRFFALIAGFCEIGEAPEDTVRREVLEEVGLRVKNIRYYASQPWGIDGNLSLGFIADLDGSDAIQIEEDELSQALWVKREEVPQRGNTLALTAEMMEAFRTGLI